MKKQKKFNPRIYLYAAELQAQYKPDTHLSRYSCNNIASAVFHLILGERDIFNPEYDHVIRLYQDVYALYFKPDIAYNIFDTLGWWHDDENEPRIIALILMYEIAKDLKRKKTKKKPNKKRS